jgi:hypothetical protein
MAALAAPQPDRWSGGIVMDHSTVASPFSSMAGMAVFAFFTLLIVASMWRLFSKAGEAGWKCLVPFLGAFVYLRITGRPAWWFVLMIIPVINIIPAIVTCFDLARVFGKGPGFGFGILMLGPIFIPVLAFGGARYVGGPQSPAPAYRAAA